MSLHVVLKLLVVMYEILPISIIMKWKIVLVNSTICSGKIRNQNSLIFIRKRPYAIDKSLDKKKLLVLCDRKVQGSGPIESL